MATNIKKVQTSAGTHEVEALHFIFNNLDTPESWKNYIDAQAGAGFSFVVSNAANNTPKGVTFTPKGGSAQITGTLEASAALKGIYLVYHPHTLATGDIVDSYDEYVAAGASTSAFWEKLGNTDIDLSGKADKGTYQSTEAGAHTHTVTVPTVSKTGKKLSASATQGTVTPSSDEVLGSGTTFTTTVTPTTTNIKATASGTAVGANGTATCLTGVRASGSDTFIKSAIKSASLDVATTQTSGDGRQAIVTNVGASTLSGTTTFNTDAIKSASLTGTTTFAKEGIASATLDVKTSSATGYQPVVTASSPSLSGQTNVPTNAIKGGSITGTALGSATFTPSVSTDGVLSFSFSTGNATLGFSGTAADTAAVSVSAGATTKYVKVNTTSAETGTVGISTSAASTGTVSISSGTVTTKYAKVTTTAADSTGTAITGVEANGTATALTGVKVTTQPTVSLSTGASAATGVISVATGITSASTSASGDMVSALTGVTVGNPTVTLSNTGSTGIDYIESVTVGTNSATTNEKGAHTHSTTI